MGVQGTEVTKESSDDIFTSVIKVGKWSISICGNISEFNWILLLISAILIIGSAAAIHPNVQDLRNGSNSSAADFAVRPVTSVSNPFQHDITKIAGSPHHSMSGERPVASAPNFYCSNHSGSQP